MSGSGRRSSVNKSQLMLYFLPLPANRKSLPALACKPEVTTCPGLQTGKPLPDQPCLLMTFTTTEKVKNSKERTNVRTGTTVHTHKIKTLKHSLLLPHNSF